MGRINEILESGQAPGLVTGQRPFDQTSVFHKAPKAIREMENTPRFKHGPNHSARDIAKHFGMSTSFINETWRKPLPKAVACLLGLFLCLSSHASQLLSGEILVDGQTVHASDLNNLVGNAILLPGAISSQPLQAFNSSDYLLLYSPINGVLYRQTALNIFQSGTLIQLLPAGVPVFTNMDLFPFYSANGTNQEAVTFSNLAQIVISNANPSYLSFATTNAGSGTNINYLTQWPGLFSGFNTNVQPFSLWWGPNGVPYYNSLSNIEKNVASDLGTNLFLSYMFTHTFFPWKVYGTNSTTNIWSYNTNFPIVSLFVAPTNAPLLNDTDTVPVLSGAEGNTNTTATLLALYQYMTNKNALPPYTIARVQFSGFPATETVTNMRTDTGIVTNIADAAGWTTPTAMSFLGKASQMPTTPLVQSNTVYFALLTNTTPIGFQLYTNYNQAVARTNAIVGNGVNNSTAGTMYWITNYTSVNCDAIQLSSTTSIRTGVYGIVFRGPVANALYYITGLQGSADSSFGWVQMDLQNAWDYPNTNYCTIGSHQSGAGYQSIPLIHVLIQPQ